VVAMSTWGAISSAICSHGTGIAGPESYRIGPICYVDRRQKMLINYAIAIIAMLVCEYVSRFTEWLKIVSCS